MIIIPPRTLIIRADAGPSVGSGHIMRCLALAEAWIESKGPVVFVISTPSPQLEERLVSEAMSIIHMACEPGSIEDARGCIRIAQKMDPAWIVADGYNFGAEFQKLVKESGFPLLIIDDYGHATHYYADIVLNQNNYADMALYPNYERETRFLLGTGFTLLRREFLNQYRYVRDIPEVAQKILVTFGGADPENDTLSVIEILKQIEFPHIEVIVVIGGVNPHDEKIQQSIQKHPQFSLLKNISNIPELMAWADIAISAGGSTCWEFAFMGLPCLVHAVAENQRPVVRSMISLGMADELTDQDLSEPLTGAKKVSELLFSKDRRLANSRQMQKIVDGEGAFRVSMIMNHDTIRLRYARDSDCDLVFQWINDPTVRTWSFQQHFITYEEHKKWFSSVIADKNILYFIAVDEHDRPVGQARFKTGSDKVVISVLLDPAFRNKGLGPILIGSATQRLFSLTSLNEVHAFIKTGNVSSLKAFVKAGYYPEENTIIENQEAYHLKRKRGDD